MTTVTPLILNKLYINRETKEVVELFHFDEYSVEFLIIKKGEHPVYNGRLATFSFPEAGSTDTELTETFIKHFVVCGYNYNRIWEDLINDANQY